MNTTNRQIATFLVLGLASFAVPAQSTQCNADHLLVTETVNHHSSDIVRLSALSLLTSDQFQEAKKSASFGGSLLVDAIPIKGYATYNDFRRALVREKSLYQYSLDETRIRGVAQQYLSATGAEAYVKCVELTSRNEAGAHMWAEQVSPQSATVVVKVRWRGAPGQASTDQVSFQVAAGARSDKAFPRKWDNGQTDSFIFVRDLDKDFVVVASIGGTDASVAIPAPQKLRRVETRSVESHEIAVSSGGRVGPGRHKAEACFNADAKDGAVFNGESAQLVVQRIRSPGPKFNTADIFVRDDYRICWEVTAATTAKEIEVKTVAKVNVVQRRTLPD